MRCPGIGELPRRCLNADIACETAGGHLVSSEAVSMRSARPCRRAQIATHLFSASSDESILALPSSCAGVMRASTLRNRAFERACVLR